MFVIPEEEKKKVTFLKSIKRGKEGGEKREDTQWVKEINWISFGIYQTLFSILSPAPPCKIFLKCNDLC